MPFETLLVHVLSHVSHMTMRELNLLLSHYVAYRIIRATWRTPYRLLGSRKKLTFAVVALMFFILQQMGYYVQKKVFYQLYYYMIKQPVDFVWRVLRQIVKTIYNRIRQLRRGFYSKSRTPSPTH